MRGRAWACLATCTNLSVKVLLVEDGVSVAGAAQEA